MLDRGEAEIIPREMFTDEGTISMKTENQKEDDVKDSKSKN